MKYVQRGVKLARSAILKILIFLIDFCFITFSIFYDGLCKLYVSLLIRFQF
jgi:hypothetical protein